MLDDRDRDAGDVALLERVRSDQVRAHLSGDADERRRVHPGVGDRGDEVRRAWPGRRDRDARRVPRPRVALRHVPCALLVAREDVPHGRPARERVVGREDGAAGKPEGDVDSLGLERAEDRVGAAHLAHACAPRRELGVASRAREVGEDDVGELPCRRGDAVPTGDEVGRARRSHSVEHGAGQGLRRPALAEPLAEHERRGQQHRGGVGDSLARDVLGRSVSRSEHARPAACEPAGRCDARSPSVGDEADQRLGIGRRRDDDVEPLGLEREVVHGGLDGELLHLHAVVPRRFTRERGDPRGIAADGRDACTAGASRRRTRGRASIRASSRGEG